MKTHIQALGWINIAFGALWAFPAFILFVVAPVTGDFVAASILSAIGWLLMALALPSIICGIGLLQLAPWARYVALILAVFAFLSFPIGTAVAIYAFWVLLQKETVHLMAS